MSGTLGAVYRSSSKECLYHTEEITFCNYDGCNFNSTTMIYVTQLGSITILNKVAVLGMASIVTFLFAI